MKKCSRCGFSNPDEGAFCRQCGAKLEPESFNKAGTVNQTAGKSGKKGWAVKVSAVVFLLLAITAASFFMFSGNSEKEYQEKIEEAEKYLYELDFEKAEELFIEARTIDPKKQESYEQLYRIYTIQEQPEKAEEVKEMAVENLPEETLPVFEKRIEVISEDERPDPEREVIADLGKLDVAPLSLDKKSWLIVQDGTYKFLYPDGTMLDVTPGNEFSLLNGAINPGDVKYIACIGSTEDSAYNGSYDSGNFTLNGACGGGGVIPDRPYVIDENKKVRLSDSAKGISDQTSVAMPDSPVVVRKDATLKGDYYIYNPSDDEAYGPYKEDEISSFYTLLAAFPGSNMKSSYGLMQRTGSPFWVKNNNSDSRTEDDDPYSYDQIENIYTLYSADGSESVDGYSDVLSTDPFSIGAFKSKRFYLLDENLKPVYDGLYDAGVTPILGRALVKTDGSWKLIEVDPSFKKEIEKEKTAREEAAEAEDSTKEFFKDFQGSYFKANPGRWASEMKIDENGNVHGEAHVGYSHNSTVYATDYSAVFEVIDLPTVTAPGRMKLSNLSYITEPGKTEQREGYTWNFETTDGYFVREGQEYLIYLPGTSVSLLPEEIRKIYLGWFPGSEVIGQKLYISDEASSMMFLPDEYKYV